MTKAGYPDDRKIDTDESIDIVRKRDKVRIRGKVVAVSYMHEAVEHPWEGEPKRINFTYTVETGKNKTEQITDDDF